MKLEKNADKVQRMDFKHPILIVDTETGGLNPNYEIEWEVGGVKVNGQVNGKVLKVAPPILEIGAVLLNPKTLAEDQSFHCICGPEKGQTVDQLFSSCTEQALKVNGFRQKKGELEKAQPLTTCLKDFAQWIRGIGKHVLSGQNVRFDMLMLNAACRRAGVNLELKGPVLELQTLSLAYFGLQDHHLPSISLSKVAKEFGFDVSGAHSAVFDCRMVASCLIKIFSDLRQQKIS